MPLSNEDATRKKEHEEVKLYQCWGADGSWDDYNIFSIKLIKFSVEKILIFLMILESIYQNYSTISHLTENYVPRLKFANRWNLHKAPNKCLLFINRFIKDPQWVSSLFFK